MTNQEQTASFFKDVAELFTKPDAFRMVLILITALILSYWLSRFLAQAIVRVAQIVALRSDNESNDLRATRLRQTETYLSIATAIVRALVVLVVGYITWRLLSPFASSNSATT